MRHNRLTAVIFACTIALVACSNDEEISKDLENKTGDELVISAGLETSVVTDAKGRSTKASLPAVGSVTAFTNQEFTLIVKENRTGEDQGKSLTVATAKTDATLTGTPIGVHDNQVDPAKATLTPKLYWDDWGGKLANINLVGIHPATANPGLKTDNIIWEVQSDQSSGSTASDLMLAYRPAYTYSDKSTAANLNFNHVMAKVTIHLIKGANYGTTGFLNPVVTITNTPTGGTINIVPTTCSGDDRTYAITSPLPVGDINPTTPVKEADGSTYTTTVLVVPATLTPGTVIANVTVDGNTYKVKVPNLPAEGTPLVAGKNNVFNVTVNKSDVAVSATLTGWKENILPPVTSQLVDVSVLPIADTEITAGSTLLVSIVDAKNITHQVTYTATTGTNNELYWTIAESPTNPKLYWDNISFPTDGSKLTATALLKVGGESSADICTGSFTEITGAQDKLVFKLERRMSLITIKLKTTTGTDAVTFSESDRVTLPDYTIYKVNGTELTGTTTPIVDLPVNYLKKEDTNATWVYQTIIYPQTITKGKDIIQIKIGENIYNVKASADKDVVFAASNEYQYTITIRKVGISTSATITGWTTTNSDIDTNLDK